jgi:rare lipoprotein A
MTAVGPYRTRGVASWYGRRYHGKLTSTGEVYDMYGMSAAHPTLPLPSYVRVTHVASGKSVVVRVNDRGPFIDSRLIDLSYVAAYKLGVLAGGSALVEVEAIVPGAPVLAAAVTAAPVPSRPTAGASASAADVPVPAPAERQIPLATEGGRPHLQLAAFSSNENAEAYVSRLRGDVAWLTGQLQVYVRNGLHCVLAGPFANQGEARQAADRISQAMGIKPFVLIR